MTAIDQAGSVRNGEELDLARMDAYLRTQIAGLEGTPRITQFPGGASNLTYLITYDNREMVLRRPPFGKKVKSAHDMGREYRVMQGLRPHFPYVPEMLAFCEDESVLGCEFYVMDRVRGIILRGDMPEELQFTPEQHRKLCESVIDRLVDLHQVPWKGTALADLYREGDYVERQISGWSDRYRNAKTDNAPDFESVMAWLNEKRPTQVNACVIHNDYRFDNVILDPQQPMNVIGVLDWEMATIGDPLMDLGNSLAYWVEANDPAPFQMLRRQPTHLPGMMTRQEMVNYYCQRTGLDVPNFDFYEVYGLFRLVVILQQIYYRFHHGQTQDKRFAGFINVVQFLEGYLADKIGKSEL
ncbi:MAG: phosphotransferase family protein [Hahellaceae bacterium]|nr:phosphotransferase family protein [Hahellaceae bacterium]MCP5170088.1 phosphotransferase family protein [Hahellaceae bacterium]